MERLRPAAILALCGLVALPGCDGQQTDGDGDADADSDSDGDGDGDADADGGGDAGDAGSLDRFLEENGIARMELLPDGTELGRGVTDEAGIVRFYSELHETVFDMAMSDEADSPAAGLDVLVSAGPESAVAYVEDSAGALAPLLFATALPSADASLAVNGVDLLTRDAGLLDFVPEDPSPFGEAFTFAGISVTFSIQGVLTTMGATVALNVLKTLVTETCKFFAPVHVEMCQLVGNVVYAAGSLAVGALNLAGATLFSAAVDVIGENLGDYACEPLGKTVVGFVQGANDTAARDRYREIARKYNYILARLETDPPDNAAEVWAEMEAIGPQLGAVGRVVRNRYFELYNPGAESALPGLAMGTAVDLTAASVEVDRVFREFVLSRVTLEEGYEAILHLTDSSISYSVTRWSYTTLEFDQIEFTEESAWKNVVGPLADCAFNFVKGVVGQVQEGAAYRDANLEVAALTSAILDVWDARMDYIYDNAWGGDIPPGPCLPDEYEPNGTWESAVASPTPVVTEAGVIYIYDVNLCDSLGTGITEEDWYAYWIAPIEFRVAAMITDDRATVGTDQELCLEMYFYSEIYEIGGMPPDLVAGPVCGPVSSWPSIPTFGIRRTMGETWSMLLPHVYAPSPTAAEIEYSLRFTP